MFFFLSFLCVALVIGAPTAMWFKTWPDALLRWLPRGQFRDAVVPKFRADGPPMEVRFAALGSWVLGAMLVPGLLMGLLGLVMMGLGLVSIPGLILAHDGKSLGQQLVERFTLFDALAKLIGHGAQTRVVQRFEPGLKRVDLLHRAAVALEQAIVSTAEDLGQYLGEHAATGRFWCSERSALRAAPRSGAA